MPDGKKVKLVLTFITIIILVFTAYKIITTYAVFYSEMHGTTGKDVAKWNITINEEEITAGITEEFTIDNFSTEENQYVETGKLAPGTTGSFIIEIDPTDTQVSIIYDISINTEYITNNKIKLTSVSKTEGNNTIIKTDEDEDIEIYTGVILLEDIDGTYKDEITIIFTWENDENNNAKDTTIGTTPNPKISIPIVVNLRQYLGETITPYT